MRPRTNLVFLGALAFLQLNGFAAGLSVETGVPVFQYYGPDQYSAQPQNWAIAQDKRGVMYFGNTDGVLQYDGPTWHLTRLKNGSRASALAVSDENRIFVGTQGDFGYLEPEGSGTLTFVSLLNKVPEADRKFTDIWRILPTKEGVYFSSYARLFLLRKDGSIKIWRPVSTFGRAFEVLNSIYVKTREQGLLRMVDGQFLPVKGGALFSAVGITDAISAEDGSALLATPLQIYRLTADGDVQPFPTSADSWFASNRLYTIRRMPNGGIAAGTLFGGLAFLNKNGDLDRIISQKAGLPDDHIESISVDSQDGIWLATNKGLIRFSLGLSVFPPVLGLDGDSQCMLRHDDTLYDGTSAGLFRLKASSGQLPAFERVEGLNAAVWTVQRFGGDLLAATDAGLFQITGNHALPIFVPKPNVLWDVTSGTSDPTIAYAVGQAGVFMLRQAGKRWEKVAEFKAPGQEFRSILEDAPGKVWVTTREVIWRIDFNQQPARAERFDAAQGVPAVPGGWIGVRHLGDHITFTTSKGLRRYSESLHRFAPDCSIGRDFCDGSRDVINLFESRNGDTWVTGEKYHGVLLKQTTGTRWYPMPLQAAGIKEIFWMSLDDDGSAWATGAKLVLYRWDRQLAGNPDNNFNVLTRLVQTNRRNTFYGGAGPLGYHKLPWQQNDLYFEFAAPFFEDPASVEYQTKLEGSDKDWSPWTHDTSRNYTHLEERGDYRFLVRARTPHGTVAEQGDFAFGILPPWYRTWWAYSIYVALFGVGVWQLVKWRTHQLVEDKRRLEGIVEERTVEIRQQRDEIHAQERKGHALLLNILPEKVADELKTTGAVQPVGFDEVTVCFTDFVGFTLSSEKLPPDHLVSALNEYFTAFDEIVARYGLEKMKTIGDAYMFASGLPARRASHAVDAVLAAIEMAEVVKRLAKKEGGTGWNIRIGLHSGPVVAGVVGIKKFAFDIWGNTVNFAARMESSGVPGRVNMSERTCRLTRELIQCEFRGDVKIKEGRYLPMYLAEAPAHDFARLYRAEFGMEPRSMPALEQTLETGKTAGALVT